jgi:hypothetical protein
MIRVQNPGNVEHGVQQLLLDGQQLNKNSIPLIDNGQEYEVVVIMGNKV